MIPLLSERLSYNFKYKFKMYIKNKHHPINLHFTKVKKGGEVIKVEVDVTSNFYIIGQVCHISKKKEKKQRHK